MANRVIRKISKDPIGQENELKKTSGTKDELKPLLRPHGLGSYDIEIDLTDKNYKKLLKQVLEPRDYIKDLTIFFYSRYRDYLACVYPHEKIIEWKPPETNICKEDLNKFLNFLREAKKRNYKFRESDVGSSKWYKKGSPFYNQRLYTITKRYEDIITQTIQKRRS